MQVPNWLSGFVTTTLTAPAACAGVVAVMDVALTTMIDVAAAPPKVTFAPAWKAVPVIVTLVPPASAPELGEMDVGAGGATKVKPLLMLAVCPSGFVTATVAGPAA